MKYLIALFVAASVSAFAQTNLRTVMTDTNGVVQRPTNFISTNRIVSVDTNGSVSNPTNFWTANSNSINSVISNSQNSTDFIFNRIQSAFASLSTDVVNGEISASNSIIAANISGTNASGKAAIRLIRSVNSSIYGGSGTLFGSDSHTMWVRLQSVPRHGTIRAVLGNNIGTTTNIAEYPTDRAIGFEFSESSGTNQVRLIAHNGTTNTNGSWVAIGIFSQKYWIGVEQNKTNGEVKLYVGLDYAAPTNNTNATILGGPTNNSGQNLSSFDIGLFTTNTNSLSSAFTAFSAFVDVTD